MAWRPSCWRRTAVSLWSGTARTGWSVSAAGTRAAAPATATTRAVGALSRQRDARDRPPLRGHPRAFRLTSRLRTSRPVTPSQAPRGNLRAVVVGRGLSETGSTQQVRGRTSEDDDITSGGVEGPDLGRRESYVDAHEGRVTRGQTSESGDRSNAPRRQLATRSITPWSRAIPAAQLSLSSSSEGVSCGEPAIESCPLDPCPELLLGVPSTSKAPTPTTRVGPLGRQRKGLFCSGRCEGESCRRLRRRHHPERHVETPTMTG
jgi:hypothetical protein